VSVGLCALLHKNQAALLRSWTSGGRPTSCFPCSSRYLIARTKSYSDVNQLNLYCRFRFEYRSSDYIENLAEMSIWDADPAD